ncbi:protein maelstrom homolog [Macrosteles quadrilineatus]|uniref:protein maelstrom homolog n=1 Tax=Macrosteles quadrilineatus TaxID=74068 RepID=UPI0023E10AE2|nr:protein maelstrom homolog [Macrosteles quadrilineatus]
MPKKKTPANAFYFFMLDRKAAYEKNGERFPNGLKDVSEVAGPEWAVLPASQKKKYEEMAKKEKERQKGDTARKYTNLHNSFDYLQKTQQELEEQKRQINENIEKTVRSICSTRKVPTFKFYFIHINYFCISDGQVYHPAEIAVSEFCLAEGVTNIYHTIIGQKQIPMGYRLDAMTRSDEVHHIPLEGEEGEKSIYVVWDNVKAVLERGRSAHGGSYPPMYTMPDNVSLNTSISCVTNVVRMMAEASGDNPDDFQVFPLEKLFYELKYGCATVAGAAKDIRNYYPSVPFACSRLENDTFNYTEEIACAFHIEIEQVVNCSKSFVQRWAYIICDQCCAYLDISVVPGKHVPSNSAVESLDKFKERQRVRAAEEAAAAAVKAAQKPFTMVSGNTVQSFAPVEVEQQPVAKPTVQPSLQRPMTRPSSQNFNLDSDFPVGLVSRGRGRAPGVSRGAPPGGSQSAPMSFAAATWGKK